MLDQLTNNFFILPFSAALFLSLWLTPLTCRLSRLLGAVDRPDRDRKVHARVIPRLGGLAMVAALLASVLLFAPIDRRLAGFVLGALIVSSAGFVDDVRHVRPWVKFAFEIAAAGVFILVGGVSLSSLGDFLGVGEVATGALSPLVTVFCMVGVMNALNLSDGLDGLAGGLSAVACVTLGLFAYLNGDWLSLSILLGLLGSVIGFLRYNSYPATLFMGDTGSLLLGYTLGAVAVLMVQGGTTAFRVGPVTVGTVLALPIIDTLLVMVRRVRHGRNPFHPDKTHLHHRLLDLGLPHEAVVPVLYISMGAFGFLAWVSLSWRESAAFAGVLLLGAAIYGSIFLARKTMALGHRFPGRSGRRRRSAPGHAFGVFLGKTTPAFIWIIVIGLFIPTAVIGPVATSSGMIALAAAGFVAAVFPWRSRGARSAVCYGSVYAACACFLAILHLAPEAPGWLPGYLSGLSLVTLLWVILKMNFRGHGKVVLTSAFETLLIGTSLFIPMVLVPAMDLGAATRNVLLVVCAEAVCFLMAFKILIRRQPQRNFVFAACFLIALLIVGAKGLLKGPPDALASPHRASSPYASSVAPSSAPPSPPRFEFPARLASAP